MIKESSQCNMGRGSSSTSIINGKSNSAVDLSGCPQWTSYYDDANGQQIELKTILIDGCSGFPQSSGWKRVPM